MCVKKEDDICTTVVYVWKSHENHLVQFSHAKIVGFPWHVIVEPFMWSVHRKVARVAYHYNKPSVHVCPRTSVHGAIQNECNLVVRALFWGRPPALCHSMISCSRDSSVSNHIHISCAGNFSKIKDKSFSKQSSKDYQFCGDNQVELISTLVCKFLQWWCTKGFQLWWRLCPSAA
jgi:hypothetical protein